MEFHDRYSCINVLFIIILSSNTSRNFEQRLFLVRVPETAGTVIQEAYDTAPKSAIEIETIHLLFTKFYP